MQVKPSSDVATRQKGTCSQGAPLHIVHGASKKSTRPDIIRFKTDPSNQITPYTYIKEAHRLFFPFLDPPSTLFLSFIFFL